MYKRSIIVLIILFFNSYLIFAQEEEIGTEVVNIVKPYSPSISDAFKVKETPVLGDTLTSTKKVVVYEIFSVPVASTFTPAKGKAANVKKSSPQKQFDNYTTLGFGNYTSILTEFFSNFQISRTDDFGLNFKHNSSQGGIEDIRLSNKYYDTQLDGNYTSRSKDLTFMINAGVEHQIYNWYGLNELFDSVGEEFIDMIDPKQSYTSGYVGGNLNLDESFFDELSFSIRYLTDKFSSSEIQVGVHPETSFPINELALKITGEFDYLTGSFDRNYDNASEMNYGFLKAGLSPSIVFVNNDLTISLGATGTALLDNNNETELFIYPKVNVSYPLLDEQVIVYGGVDVGLTQNSYYRLKEMNPFISPTLTITPTSQLYNAFAGLKGNLSNKVGYNLRASYGKEENKALFNINRFKGTQEQSYGYEYGNSFNVIYDDVTTLSVFGELKIEPSKNFSLGISGTFNSYDTNNISEAWNLPNIEASIFTNFNISEKIYGGIYFFFVGDRNELFVGDSGPFSLPSSEVISLDGYFDANVHAGYRFNEQLSFFIKGSNLLGDNYEKWLNYPVQGIQGLFGVTYKFDW